jgi:ATP-dependent exoDNAse (exonuclease V) alpha subunit
VIVMAIYHFSAKVISRAAGSSALAAAAYRSASRLRDDRLDRTHDFSNKTGVVHSEVMLPDDAPDEWHDRERLWNAVEAVEIRKDAQLAREVEFAIPRELDQAQGIELAREFVQREFVDRGMVADLNVHCDIGADGEAKPHAHVMLGMREVNENGFGQKVREWNRTELLTHWREAWADQVNARLNQDARERLRDNGALGDEVELSVARGERSFATGDRVMFLRNERSPGVKNGTLGTIEQIDDIGMTVATDAGCEVRFDHKDYNDIDHGYAATIHKAQPGARGGGSERQGALAAA